MRVLLLAGTAEARAVAAGLAGMPGVEATASLAGVTRAPAPLPVAVRTGGFGGAGGLASWLREQGTGALIDATHPFAARMAANAAEACAMAGVARLRLVRPEWPARPEWLGVRRLAEAAAALPPGARVLLTSGRSWAPFAGRADCRFWLRSIEPVDLPDHIEPVLGRPPFAREDELALMRRLAVTHLVAKNAGGDPARLEAALELGVAVLMVARPAAPPGPVVARPEEALAWLARLVAAEMDQPLPRATAILPPDTVPGDA
jgi:precorrin-6A/cobalt-precorrin-6A reductase